MRPLDLLLDFHRQGFSFRIDGDTLYVSPSEKLVPEQLALLREHKRSLLALLVGGYWPEAVIDALADSPPDWNLPGGDVRLEERHLVLLGNRLVAFEEVPETWGR